LWGISPTDAATFVFVSGLFAARADDREPVAGVAEHWVELGEYAAERIVRSRSNANSRTINRRSASFELHL